MKMGRRVQALLLAFRAERATASTMKEHADLALPYHRRQRASRRRDGSTVRSGEEIHAGGSRYAPLPHPPLPLRPALGVTNDGDRDMHCSCLIRQDCRARLVASRCQEPLLCFSNY
ncbi:hypothetical protein BJY59DRAFT_723640, partial [Rhodotorula toruloides]